MLHKGIVVLVFRIVLGLCLFRAGAAFAQEEKWIVVTPPEFRESLTPLIEHREAQGFKVVVVQTTDILNEQQLRDRDVTPLKTRLNELCQQNKGRSYVLLAGIFGVDGQTNDPGAVVPSLHGSVERMKGEPSDSGYALPAEDGSPTVAVGRFPARNRAELDAMVEKTLRFECDSQPAQWQNRLSLFVGDPGGGALAEMFVQQALKGDLALLHPSWTVRTIFSAASSPFYLPGRRDRETALRYLSEGNLFSIYLGHSYRAGLGLDGKFMTGGDWAKVRIPNGAGPFFTCGCWACQTTAKGDGYGLSAMRNPTGPVAVIGATGESFGFAATLMAEGLLGRISEPPFPSRLADYWLSVAAGLAHGKMDAGMFALLDMADGTGGKVPLAVQRREHLEMWMLLGDPALRLPVTPVDISLKLTQPAAAGKEVAISGVLPDRLSGAQVQLSLERPLNSFPVSLPELPSNSPTNRDARQRAFIARHESANSFVLTSAEAKASGNRFAGSLHVPSAIPWSNVVLRASATLAKEAGIGVVVVPVKR
jgi:hypothetical protein